MMSTSIPMKFLNKFLNNETTFEDQYLSSLKDRIFSIHYFTNKDILLLKQVEFNNIPKKIIRELIVQFILSRVPADFINDVNGNVKYLKAYSNQDYEVHHIIPLNTCKTVGQSTKDLRNNDEHYLNSPINFTIISSEANKSISSESLDSYSTRLPSLSNLNHFLPPLNFLASDNSEQKQKEWLSLRYDTIKASLATMLNDLSNNI